MSSEEYRHYSDRERMVHRLQTMRTELERERAFIAVPPDYISSLDQRIERLKRLNEAHLRRLRASHYSEYQLVEEARDDRARR